MPHAWLLPSAVRPSTLPLAAAMLSLTAVVAAAVPLIPVDATAQAPYRATRTAMPPPDGLAETVAAHVDAAAVTVLDANDDPIMDLWFAKELPPSTAVDPHPGLAYGTLNEGVVLGVMRVHREHHDYRDQPVGEGVYVVRYLRQPDDGNHLGETTYRDFAVLTPMSTAAVGPQSYDDTLNEALALNLHPFAWALWPAREIAVEGELGIAALQSDKWAIKLSIPRADGDDLSLAMVVVGNEWHY